MTEFKERPRVINDYIFKKIFSKKGNESILRDFLIGVLELPIEKVETKAEQYIIGQEFTIMN